MKWSNETRKVNELIEWDKNPRQITKDQFELLKENVTKYGFTNPVIINTDNRIIAGHMRKRVLIALGRGNEEIPVRVPDRTLTDREYEELAIRDNKNTGEWDIDTLANDFDIGDLLDWGFTEAELSIDLDIDYDKEWEGMPEYENENKKAFRDIIIHFKDKDSVDEFFNLIDQKYTDKTKMIWFPEIEIEKYSDKLYE